jgi:hypothetical protein
MPMESNKQCMHKRRLVASSRLRSRASVERGGIHELERALK